MFFEQKTKKNGGQKKKAVGKSPSGGRNKSDPSGLFGGRNKDEGGSGGGVGTSGTSFCGGCGFKQYTRPDFFFFFFFFFLHLVVFHWPFQSRFRTVRFKPMHQSMAVCVPVANSEQFQSLNSSEFNVMDWGNEFRAVSEQPLNWLKTQWIQW